MVFLIFEILIIFIKPACDDLVRYPKYSAMAEKEGGRKEIETKWKTHGDSRSDAQILQSHTYILSKLTLAFITFNLILKNPYIS